MPQKAMVQGHKINNKIWKFASNVTYFAPSFAEAAQKSSNGNIIKTGRV